AWASTTRTLAQILPAEPGLFDLVILDEASQCDLATAAAALLRGKRAVIVGDPRQLRHITFLSKAREQAAFAERGLDERTQTRLGFRRSLFDVAADAVPRDCFFLLDQHFRSDPRIIEFSNKRFYSDSLRIMTERPRRGTRTAVRAVHVDGRRNANDSVNPDEVEAVMGEIGALVEQPAPDSEAPLSIGIVSPFRDHVDAVRDALLRRFPDAVDRHRMVVGTAHSLQGDEKDVVILTTSIDRASHSGSLRFLQNPNLFNVAITRARRMMIVVSSVKADELPPGLLQSYLRHAEETPRPGERGKQTGRELVDGLARMIRGDDVEIQLSFRSAGLTIDMAVADDRNFAAVLCGPEQQELEDQPDALTRRRILARAGWKIKRVFARAWREDPHACLEHVRQALQ
ncbi:MAG: AAA domain-containing protein, partial [Planctomycetales bacterium]